MRLVGVPLPMLKWTSEQYDALFRELRLIVADATWTASTRCPAG